MYFGFCGGAYKRCTCSGLKFQLEVSARPVVLLVFVSRSLRYSIIMIHDLLVQCRALVRAVHYRAQQLELIVDEECKASVLSMMQVGEALETDQADPIEVVEPDDHGYCMPSTLRRRPQTVKGDVPTRWHSILAMFESLL